MNPSSEQEDIQKKKDAISPGACLAGEEVARCKGKDTGEDGVPPRPRAPDLL